MARALLFLACVAACTAAEQNQRTTESTDPIIDRYSGVYSSEEPKLVTDGATSSSEALNGGFKPSKVPSTLHHPTTDPSATPTEGPLFPDEKLPTAKDKITANYSSRQVIDDPVKKPIVADISTEPAHELTPICSDCTTAEPDTSSFYDTVARKFRDSVYRYETTEYSANMQNDTATNVSIDEDQDEEMPTSWTITDKPWYNDSEIGGFTDVYERVSTSAGVNVSGAVWPVKHSAVVEGDLVLGGLMMVHEREDSITCGPVMPQGGIQALEAMLYTLDRINEDPAILPNVTLGAHILDDCDKDTYGLEMAVDFIKGKAQIFQ